MTSLFDNIDNNPIKHSDIPIEKKMVIKTKSTKKDWFQEILDKTDEMDNWPDYEPATYGSWK